MLEAPEEVRRTWNDGADEANYWREQATQWHRIARTWESLYESLRNRTGSATLLLIDRMHKIVLLREECIDPEDNEPFDGSYAKKFAREVVAVLDGKRD